MRPKNAFFNTPNNILKAVQNWINSELNIINQNFIFGSHSRSCCYFLRLPDVMDAIYCISRLLLIDFWPCIYHCHYKSCCWGIEFINLFSQKASCWGLSIKREGLFPLVILKWRFFSHFSTVKKVSWDFRRNFIQGLRDVSRVCHCILGRTCSSVGHRE